MKQAILYCMLITLMASIMPASAYWNESGFPLEDHLVAQGTVNGSVYVGGGHGKADATDYTTPYTELFEVPSGGVKFARLYTGGMFCSKTGATWLNMTLNGESLGNLTIEGLSDTNPNVYMYDSGSGGWIYYDITDRVVAGAINNATLYGDAIYDADGKKLGYGTKYIYGIVMVVVYEDPEKPVTQYWIREGADYLHKETTYAAERKNTTVTFPGANISTCENATLHTAQCYGKDEFNETLWVNGELAACDIAGERDGYRFDINRTEITPYLKESDNYVTYERGDGSMNIGCSVLVLENGRTIEEPTISVSMDKFRYIPGDTMTVVLDITNPTEDMVMAQWYWGVPQFSVWSCVRSVPIPAGYNDTLDFSFTLPNWGLRHFGNVFYVQLLDATSGEVLNADVACWTYCPDEDVVMTRSVDIPKEIKKTIKTIRKGKMDTKGVK